MLKIQDCRRLLTTLCIETLASAKWVTNAGQCTVKKCRQILVNDARFHADKRMSTRSSRRTYVQTALKPGNRSGIPLEVKYRSQ